MDLRNSLQRRFVTVGMVWLIGMSAFGADPKNIDESKVPSYRLPKLLELQDGKPVKTAEDWSRRREELLRIFETHVYGRTPKKPLPTIEYSQLEAAVPALGGVGFREQVRMTIGGELKADVLIYRPKTKARGTFIGLNFRGNHTVHLDTEIVLNENWMPDDDKIGIVDHRATDKSRGTSARRWPMKMIVDAGYAVATSYCGDFDPDKYRNSFDDGVHKLYYEEGQNKPANDEWGSIGGWAWGLSRMLDYLETRDDLNSTNAIAFGHSRLGKTALWAGAQDTRFRITISNNSGCGGAALYRRRFGERIDIMAERFPDWFCVNHWRHVDGENDMPFDQHMLIALMAPRAVYVASAQEDTWADPRGEFLAALNAAPAFELLGKSGIEAMSMPAVNVPVTGTIGYHVRTGRHDVTDYDWQQYLKFANRHLSN